MALVVGLTFDIKSKKVPSGRPNDLWAEHDSEDTILAIESALKSNGNRVVYLGSSKRLLAKLPSLKCDIVFNIAEGVCGRNRESEVPIILDLLEIPYTGSDALTLSVALDKVISKKLFKYHGIPTPEYFECKDDEVILPKRIKFPLIVKPRYEGSAKGIDSGSVVRDIVSLKKQVHNVISLYRQPVLIEEFIDGWEFTVGIIGNKEPLVLPVVQRHIETETGLSSHIFDKIRKSKQKLRYRDFLCIDSELEQEIKLLALKAFTGLGCRDFARIDFRVSRSRGRKNNIYMLEINPLPSLAQDDYFAMTAELTGISYGKMISMMFETALKRCGLN